MKMKKTTLRIAAIAIAAGGIITGCGTPAEKVEKDEVEVAKAKMDLDQAQNDYLADIEKCRKETDAKIAANKKSIADFKARIANKKKEARIEYEKKIAELDKKNTDMKKRMDDYKASGKEEWELFKADLKKGMDEIAESLKDLTTK